MYIIKYDVIYFILFYFGKNELLLISGEGIFGIHVLFYATHLV